MTKEKEAAIEKEIFEEMAKVIAGRYQPAKSVAHPALLKSPIEIHQEMLQFFPDVDYAMVKAVLEDLSFEMDYEEGWMMYQVNQTMDDRP